jgi:hypothetical protein
VSLENLFSSIHFKIYITENQKYTKVIEQNYKLTDFISRRRLFADGRIQSSLIQVASIYLDIF